MMAENITELLKDVSLIPVVVINQLHEAATLGNALQIAGFNTIEVTLRTDTALPAVELLARDFPDLLVGAGSIIEPSQMTSAASAGARYAVSPGFTDQLLESACLPYLPGAATAAEIMYLRARGYSNLKFFPAEAAGGVGYLDAISGPIPDVNFCPTGGLHADSAKAYLQRDNVFAVGGSWFIDKNALQDGNVSVLSEKAAQAHREIQDA